ncbi:hypothetical protein CMEL01_06365 [Colletotrichum melonis]|uniref:Uncharacterized protein n=1 Tax=Colletotrichum melonis TaxID=1209925 RepID=A0AAI9U516_9PEZI|nr:hypothetical protein CMEL01_06365 [Colletotrichum melonis]
MYFGKAKCFPEHREFRQDSQHHPIQPTLPPNDPSPRRPQRSTTCHYTRRANLRDDNSQWYVQRPAGTCRATAIG